jgi:metalloendopeptidase OMA1, mitochondrial
MKKILLVAVMAASLVSMMIGCSRAPITGRRQLMLVKNEALIPLSFQQYKGVLDTSKVLPMSNLKAEMVARVGTKIRTAVENYLINTGQAGVIEGFQWEYNTVDQNIVNAFCMPGGKVLFYTGILPICQSEDGVAVVMGHEIAHAVASHGAERVSRAMGANTLGQVLAVGVGVATKSEDAMNIFGTLYGAGAQAGLLLPNSRKQESESDLLGLIFCQMAGYNINEAPAFWTRMAQAGAKSQKPPQWMSTHPSDETRIKNMTKWIPQVQAKWPQGR